MEYYHVYTKGLSKGVLYRNASDYVCGMNDVPICLMKTQAELLCFCLMPNHVHFVMKGDENECKKFIVDFKKRTSQRLRMKYKEVKALSNLKSSVKLIDEKKYLKTAISYVLRNPMAARLGWTPINYPWGSGEVYFQKNCTSEFVKVNELYVRELREMIGTRLNLPTEYLIKDRKFIYPGSYVNKNEVEKIFKSAKQFVYWLSRNDDGEFEINSGMIGDGAYSYDEIRTHMNEISKALYKVDDFDTLRYEDKCMVGVELRKRYRVTAKVFATISGIDVDILQSLML